MANLYRLADLGTTKATIRRRFAEDYERPADDEWANRVKILLASRRTTFTLDELEDLISVLSTSHHECVLDNTDEFHPLVVATHVRLEEKLARWHDYIRQARLASAPFAIAVALVLAPAAFKTIGFEFW